MPLLTWDSEATGQGKLVLKGKTFSDDAASEWFKSFSLEVDGEEVLALSSLGNETGARNPESSALSTMRILIDGNEPPAHFRGQYVQGASKVWVQAQPFPTATATPTSDPNPNPIQVWVQARTLPLRKVGGVPAEEVFIRTPSMVLAVSSDEARN